MTALRSVDGDAPRPRRRRTATVTDATRQGDAHAMLTRMAVVIAARVDDPNTPARDLASLTKRLMDVRHELDALDVKEQEAAKRGPAIDESFDPSAF